MATSLIQKKAIVTSFFSKAAHYRQFSKKNVVRWLFIMIAIPQKQHKVKKIKAFFLKYRRRLPLPPFLKFSGGKGFLTLHKPPRLQACL